MLQKVLIIFWQTELYHNILFFQVTHVITTHELLPKFKNVLQRTPTVKHIIFLEDQVTATDRTGFRDDVKIHAFQEVIDLGHKSTTSYAIHRPTKDDPAIIMYTSGNLLSAVSGGFSPQKFREKILYFFT